MTLFDRAGCLHIEVLYVVRGSITFGLPAGVAHDAVVGPDGVACLEGHLAV
jgi:hypothetical protein